MINEFLFSSVLLTLGFLENYLITGVKTFLFSSFKLFLIPLNIMMGLHKTITKILSKKYKTFDCTTG